jgi:hypothetical protein
MRSPCGEQQLIAPGKAVVAASLGGATYSSERS